MMALDGIHPHNDNEAFQLSCVERDLDRGVFCLDGFEWPASTRRKLQLVFSEEPRSRTLWQQLRAGPNGKSHEVLRGFEECLPRNREDEEDPRYFAIHWGVGSMRLQPETFDPLEACARFKHALLAYPDRARANHFMQFADLLQSHVSTGETDAAAVIAGELRRLDTCATCSAGERRAKLARLFSGLETRELASDRRYSRGRGGFTKRD